MMGLFGDAKPERVFRIGGEDGEIVHGMLAEFDTPADIAHAAEKVRDAGYKSWDVYAPFPIHGIDENMGLARSRLPLLVGVLGLSGAALGLFLQFVISDWLYPLSVQGKPPGAWEAYVPITFEIGVLFTAFTCIFGMFAFNQLPRWHHPLLKHERFLKTSDDRFIIAVEARDPNFDPDRTRALLEGAGGKRIDLVAE